MADTPTSSLEILKRELSRLVSFTDTIGTAKDSALESQNAAKAAIEAASKVHEQQKALLADLQREHQKSIDGQAALLRTNSQQWEEALQKQLAVALQEYGKQTEHLDKVAGQLRKDGQKQSDALSGVSDRLQVITASLTAFRDAMNAARFADRLENIGTQQDVLHKHAEAGQTSLLKQFTKLEELIIQQGISTDNQLQEIRQKVASLGKQNLVLQAGIAIGIVTLIVLHFLKIG